MLRWTAVQSPQNPPQRSDPFEDRIVLPQRPTWTFEGVVACIELELARTERRIGCPKADALGLRRLDRSRDDAQWLHSSLANARSCDPPWIRPSSRRQRRILWRGYALAWVFLPSCSNTKRRCFFWTRRLPRRRHRAIQRIQSSSHRFGQRKSRY